MPAASRIIVAVACDIHGADPQPDVCTRCRDAVQITGRLAHEQGACGGPAVCEWCAFAAGA